MPDLTRHLDLAAHEPATAPQSRGLIARCAVRCLLVLVWLYRVTLGPFIGGHCRFQPTCSQYMIDAVHKHGPWRGAWRGIKRIGRCHPWGPSGFDPA